MKVAHLTTVDLSLRYLLMPQLEAVLADGGEVVGISAPGPHVQFLEARGIRHRALAASTRSMDPLADVRAARQLWAILRDERPDVLHTHNPKTGLYGRIVGRAAGVPCVVHTTHGLYATDDDPATKRAIVYSLEAIASRFSDVEFCQNPEDVELFRRLHIVAARKLRLLGNGVDLKRFRPDLLSEIERDELRASLGLATDDIVVGCVARFVAEKGLPELVEAVVQLGPPFRLLLVGGLDEEKEDALPSSWVDDAAERGVVATSWRDDVDCLYGAMDVYCLASHREGFPRSAMEAAASGLPIVATDIRGCRQVVHDGGNGALVPVRDPRAIAAALLTYADPARRAAHGAESREFALHDMDERDVVTKVMASYADCRRRR